MTHLMRKQMMMICQMMRLSFEMNTTDWKTMNISLDTKYVISLVSVVRFEEQLEEKK